MIKQNILITPHKHVKKAGVFCQLVSIHTLPSSKAGGHNTHPVVNMSGNVFAPKKRSIRDSVNLKFRKTTSAVLVKHLLRLYSIPYQKKDGPGTTPLDTRLASARRKKGSMWGFVYKNYVGSALAVGPLLKHATPAMDAFTLAKGNSLGTPVSSVFTRSSLANGPHLVNVIRSHSRVPKKRTNWVPGYSSFQADMRRVRMRFERWFFTHLGCRTYVWFSNIWKAVRAELDDGCLSSMYARCVRQLTRRGNRFILRASQAYVTFQSIVLAVTSVTGLQFFMKMTIRLLKRHRSHWAVLMYMLGFFNVCKNHFWFKTLYQYRLVVRGKFGGYMRASQKVFQHGIVKIHQWDLKINYYRLCPITKYGVFSVRFWLQMRDMRKIRYAALTGNIPGEELLDEHSGSFVLDD